jgi:hypothetical protein
MPARCCCRHFRLCSPPTHLPRQASLHVRNNITAKYVCTYITQTTTSLSLSLSLSLPLFPCAFFISPGLAWPGSSIQFVLLASESDRTRRTDAWTIWSRQEYSSPYPIYACPPVSSLQHHSTYSTYYYYYSAVTSGREREGGSQLSRRPCSFSPSLIWRASGSRL